MKWRALKYFVHTDANKYQFRNPTRLFIQRGCAYLFYRKAVFLLLAVLAACFAEKSFFQKWIK